MSIPGSANPLLLATAAAAAAETFQISRSLRFDSGSTSSLTKSFSSNGDRQKWTFSFWIKRSKLGTKQQIFGSQGTNDGDYSEMYFDTDDKLFIRFGYTSVVDAKPAAVFRDVSAWYHIVIALDTQNSTENHRLRVYVNGTELDDYSDDSRSGFTGTYGIGRAGDHKISGEPNGSGSHIDGYMTEIHYVNGSQKAPTDFGVVDSNNNWNPKEYSGTYGTNGFYLKCADNTSSASLGTDSSGNNNTFTVTNLVADAPGLGTSHQGFDVVTWTGNGSTQTISGLGFQPDFVWIKARSAAYDHYLQDVVRGATKTLEANQTGAETTNADGVTEFTSDGFKLGAGTGNTAPNVTNVTYVGWSWKAGGAASLNESGSIDSQVSANTTYGFSIVTASPNQQAESIGHGLGATPRMIISKSRTATDDWTVYHYSAGSNEILRLNDDSVKQTVSGFWGTINSSTFAVSAGSRSHNTGDMVYYCWSEVSGFSKFGTYTGNASTNGPTITTNFKPRFILVKNIDTAARWIIWDTERDDDTLDKGLSPNLGNAEITAFNAQVLSNGFQITDVEDTLNKSGDTFIYAAYAGKPDGTPIDSLIDTPTNADADSGNNIGNYCTWNSLKPSNGAYSEGNLKFVGNSNWCHTPGTFLLSSGKWYFEGTYRGSEFGSGQGNIVSGIGFIRADAALGEGGNQEPVNNADFRSNTLAFYQNGYFTNLSSHSSVRTQISEGDVVGVSINFDAGTYAFYVNNSSVASGSLSYTGPFLPWTHVYYNNSFYDCNFGARPFAYTPPTGHKSLCTQNLSDPTIADGSTIFDAKTWVGTGSTRNITNYGFSPDWVWIKQTNATRSHNVFDTVRTAGKPLFIDLQNNELSDGRLTGFLSNGFTLDSDNAVNDSSPAAYVGYAWDAGTTTASNTDGSGPTNVEVRASQTNGFSIVKYTGNGSSGSVGHGLSVAPEWIVIKNRDASSHWHVYHVGLTSGKRLNFSNNEKEFTPGTAGITTVSNTTFTLGSSRAETNADGDDYIAYCWSPVSQFSVFGKYIGNNSDNGPYVFTGMRPKFILFKRIDADSNWRVHDTAREDYNPHDTLIFPDQNDQALANSVYKVDILSNGFKIRNTNSNFNASGGEYIYCAFAEHPFKTSRAR